MVVVTVRDLANGSVKCADAEKFVERAQRVVDYLSSLEVGKEMRCKDIADHIFYEGWNGRQYSMSVGKCSKVLTALVRGGIVKRTEVDGEPIEVDAYGYGYDESDKIWVNGVRYIREGAEQTWGQHKKTITPKVAYFSLA